MKELKLSITLYYLLGMFAINAQETVSATGGEASGTGGTVSYSIGQVDYQTRFGSNGEITEGVQQPYEISVYATLPETVGINLNCSVYPNPTTDVLTLKVENYGDQDLFFELFDMQGKLIQHGELKGETTIISMQYRSASTYFLKVTDQTTDIKTFKIIKK